MVRDVLAAQLSAVLGGASIEDYHAAYAAQHGGRSLRHAAAAAEAAVLLQPGQRDAAVQKLLQEAAPAGVHPDARTCLLCRCIACCRTVDHCTCAFPAAGDSLLPHVSNATVIRYGSCTAASELLMPQHICSIRNVVLQSLWTVLLCNVDRLDSGRWHSQARGLRGGAQAAPGRHSR